MPTLQTFDWPYYALQVIYQDNSVRVSFGRGYTFAARPEGPPQRIFKLRFEALMWELGSNGLIDTAVRPSTNLARLIEFYKAHEMWKSFWWNMPGHGWVVARFNKPLDVPYQMAGGTGAVGPIELELIEQILPYGEPVVGP